MSDGITDNNVPAVSRPEQSAVIVVAPPALEVVFHVSSGCTLGHREKTEGDSEKQKGRPSHGI